MIDKLIVLAKKHWDIVTYGFFGVLTTAVNWLVYFSCLNWLELYASVSNVIAWVISVAFAFVTNKYFVFQSRSWAARVLWPELGKFLGTRISSLIVEEVLLLLLTDVIGWDGNWTKIAVTVFVVIINYVGSKLLVFRKREM